MKVWWLYFNNPSHNRRAAAFVFTRKAAEESIKRHMLFDGCYISRFVHGEVNHEEIGTCCFLKESYTAGSRDVCSVCSNGKNRDVSAYKVRSCAVCPCFTRGIQLPVKEAAIGDGE